MGNSFEKIRWKTLIDFSRIRIVLIFLHRLVVLFRKLQKMRANTFYWTKSVKNEFAFETVWWGSTIKKNFAWKLTLLCKIDENEQSTSAQFAILYTHFLVSYPHKNTSCRFFMMKIALHLTNLMRYDEKKKTRMNAKIILPFSMDCENKKNRASYSNSHFFFIFDRYLLTSCATSKYTYIYTSGWNKIDCSLKFKITIIVAASFIESRIWSMNWWSLKMLNQAQILLFFLYDYLSICMCVWACLRMKNCLASQKGRSVDHTT